ncbi:MAG: hypothetical protein WCW13_04195 [archaeon]|jgi:hypothetical protein
MKFANKTIIFAFLLLLATMVHAIDYSIDNHTINVQISTDGKDNTIEKFFINFPTENAKIAFRDKSLELGTNLDEWTKFNPIFTPSLGQNTLNKKIAYTEGPQNYLQISYDLSEPLMAKGKETTMVTEYVLKVNYFNSFYQAGLWIIPDKTTINIELPPGAEIRDTVEPEATITTVGSRKIVAWNGYKSGNKLTLNYILWKKIDPVVDLNGLTAFLFKTQTGLILIGAIIIAIGAIIWKRKQIKEKIEEFTEKNSIIQEE